MRRSVNATRTTAMAGLVGAGLALAAALAGPSAAETEQPEPAGGQPPAYDVVGVIDGPGSAATIGHGLNEVGTVVGYTDFPLKAFTWDKPGGLMTLPGLPGYEHRLAADVNDAGTVAGHSGYSGIEFPQLAVRWVGGQPESLGTLPGDTDSHGEAINEAGTIVGWSDGGPPRAFRWTEEDGMTAITPDGVSGYAYDVNESEVITGYVDAHAFIWDDGVLTDLGAPSGYAFSFAFAINDDGVVAAHVTTATGDVERVATWTSGIGWKVLGGVGETNVAWGINNHGSVVGNGRPTAGIERAFLAYEGGAPTSLTELLTTNEWQLISADDIDDAGRIVAYGSNRDTGEGATLLLAPVATELDDRGLKVRLRGSPDPSAGLATLRVVDENGDAVRRARVVGEWSINGDLVADGADRTDRNGKARLREPLDNLATGDVVEFCITDITRPGYTYDSSPPSCASTIVP